MRADRLLQLLLLLQTRGQMTADALAEELEVSVRTIYRDMDALSAAGVPVYAERGVGGGCALVEDYQTTLTGLNQEEVLALLAISIPEPLAGLEAGQKLKAALLKVLAAAAPGTLPARPPRQKIHLDWAWWGHSGQAAPILRTLYQAVQAEECVRITFPFWNWHEMEREVEPYGLAAKAGDWFLAAGGGGKVRTYRVAELTRAELTGRRFTPPADFELAAFWRQAAHEIEQDYFNYPVHLRVAQPLWPGLHRRLLDQLRGVVVSASEPDAEGWREVEIHFSSFYAARESILGMGMHAVVLDPLPLRWSVADFARQVAQMYAEEGNA